MMAQAHIIKAHNDVTPISKILKRRDTPFLLLSIIFLLKIY